MNVLGQEIGKNWALYWGDCCQVTKGIPDNSVGLCVYSLPFSNLYIYSDSELDMSNSDDHSQFADHYRYLVPELLRVTQPGRLCVVHCKDLPLYKNRDGAMGLYPFLDDVLRVHIECGWVLHSRVTIWKDPVTEMQRTKNHGLLYKEVCKDSCGSRQGMADYLLIFRKWGSEFRNPVHVGGERFDRYIGLDPPDPTWIADECGLVRPLMNPKTGRWPRNNPFYHAHDIGEPRYDHDGNLIAEPLVERRKRAYRLWSISVWQRYASPVWMDIDQTKVLNFKVARTDQDEKHICPLQLEIPERCIHLWTNPGDVVYSPFGGIGSEPYTALKMGRKGIAVELKEEYWRKSVEYCRGLEKQMSQPSLFDSISDDAEPEDTEESAEDDQAFALASEED